MGKKVNVGVLDLELAAEWLLQYEGDGNTNAQKIEARDGVHRVAEWLRQEVAKRQENAAIREIVRQTDGKATPARAREILRKVQSEKQS
jgi:predicted transposase YbfD/YdcC